jgi:hypothetical protein
LAWTGFGEIHFASLHPCAPALKLRLSQMDVIHPRPRQINPENCPEPVSKAAMGVLPVLRNDVTD